jgi:hypothetical protein
MAEQGIIPTLNETRLCDFHTEWNQTFIIINVGILWLY